MFYKFVGFWIYRCNIPLHRKLFKKITQKSRRFRFGNGIDMWQSCIVWKQKIKKPFFFFLENQFSIGHIVYMRFVLFTLVRHAECKWFRNKISNEFSMIERLFYRFRYADRVVSNRIDRVFVSVVPLPFFPLSLYLPESRRRRQRVSSIRILFFRQVNVLTTHMCHVYVSDKMVASSIRGHFIFTSLGILGPAARRVRPENRFLSSSVGSKNANSWRVYSSARRRRLRWYNNIAGGGNIYFRFLSRQQRQKPTVVVYSVRITAVVVHTRWWYTCYIHVWIKYW